MGDLRRVPGIGASTLERLGPVMTVGGRSERVATREKKDTVAFRIQYREAAVEHLSSLTARERAMVMSEVLQQL